MEQLPKIIKTVTVGGLSKTYCYERKSVEFTFPSREKKEEFERQLQMAKTILHCSKNCETLKILLRTCCENHRQQVQVCHSDPYNPALLPIQVIKISNLIKSLQLPDEMHM